MKTDFRAVSLIGGFWLLFSIIGSAEAIEKVEKISGADPIPAFNLQSTEGSAFTKENLHGNWTLMTIGFTSCPDICPVVLSNLNAVSKSLDKDWSRSTSIVFVAVDPARDEAVLADYVKHFGDNVTGVTGDPEQLGLLVDGIGAYYALEKPKSNGYYSVKHTAFAVLVSPTAEVVARINPPIPPKDTAAELNELIVASPTH